MKNALHHVKVFIWGWSACMLIAEFAYPRMDILLLLTIALIFLWLVVDISYRLMRWWPARHV